MHTHKYAYIYIYYIYTYILTYTCISTYIHIGLWEWDLVLGTLPPEVRTYVYLASVTTTSFSLCREFAAGVDNIYVDSSIDNCQLERLWLKSNRRTVLRLERKV